MLGSEDLDIGPKRTIATGLSLDAREFRPNQASVIALLAGIEIEGRDRLDAAIRAAKEALAALGTADVPSKGPAEPAQA